MPSTWCDRPRNRTTRKELPAVPFTRVSDRGHQVVAVVINGENFPVGAPGRKEKGRSEQWACCYAFLRKLYALPPVEGEELCLDCRVRASLDSEPPETTGYGIGFHD